MIRPHVPDRARAMLLGFGATKLLAQLFLAGWEMLSLSQSDIAARGVWLLALGLPHFTIAGAVAGATAAVWATHRGGGSVIRRMLLALAGAGSGAVLLAIGTDPTAFVLHALTWSPAYYGASIGAACTIIACGLALARRMRTG